MKPLTIILLCVPLPAQSLFQSLAATLQPAGSAFTETWNSRNPAGLCWNGGPSQCRNLWTVGGIAGQSMVTSPNSPTAAQAGASAIKMTNLAGTAGYLSAYGTFPTVTVGTSHDEYVWMNLASTTVAAYATKTVYCLSQSPACVGIVARIEVNPATTGVLIHDYRKCVASSPYSYSFRHFHHMGALRVLRRRNDHRRLHL